jgi:ornithine cyclodeaminase/alanine dehydrogenase-like protein (mu-crystallin family)
LPRPAFNLVLVQRKCHPIIVQRFSPSGASGETLKKELEAELKARIEVVQSATAAVTEADLIVTATTARMPILKPEWLRPGIHINAVGSHRPGLRELDGATLVRAKVLVDSREAIMAECGDILLAIKENTFAEQDIHGEIGQVLAGTKTGRSNAGEVTVYKSVGIAIQDVATAHLVYRKASHANIGTHVPV